MSRGELKGFPISVDAERFVLGSILLNGARFPEIASALESDDFGLEAHRRIFTRISGLDRVGTKIDHVTVAEELMKFGELESVGGLGHIVSLEDGLPQISNLDAYVDMVIEKSRLRKIAYAAQHILNRAMGGSDGPDEILSGADASMLDIRKSRNSKAAWRTPGMCIEANPAGLKGIVEPKAAQGIQTPFYRLNDTLGGFRNGELIVLGGRPSHGKSACSLQFAWHAVFRLNLEVALVTLEMSAEAQVSRLIVQHGRLDAQRVKLGYTGADERRRLSLAASDVHGSMLWIDDRPGQTSSAVRRSIRELASRRPISMAIVDHAHLIAGDEDPRKRLSRIADDMQILARDLNIPVILLAQVGRKCEEDGRPPASPDLKEAGKLEENPDVIMFAYRPEMYQKFQAREDLHGVADLIITKNRNGPVGTIPLVFLGSQMRFDNRVEDVPPGEGEEEHGNPRLFN